MGIVNKGVREESIFPFLLLNHTTDTLSGKGPGFTKLLKLLTQTLGANYTYSSSSLLRIMLSPKSGLEAG